MNLADRGAETLDRSRMVLSVFEAALEQPEANREAWLDAMHGQDRDLVGRVEALLAIDQRSAAVLPTLPPLPPREKPERVGAYRLTETLGGGGMGDVYLGERDDGLFEHQVAVKVMRTSRFNDQAALLFDTERQALARLRHRGIARLFDGGVTDGQAPWFIMELIDGAPIDSYVREARLDQNGIAALMIEICGAVQYAHEHLVVHGDIKPSNILVEPGGFPRLVDFGIAQILTGAAQAESAFFPSTPAFASPDRRAGQRPKPSDDVYSLGVLLASLLDTASASKAGSDLEAIMGKARIAEPDRRYASVAAFREDLQRWMAHRPVSARPARATHALRLFLRRNRWPVAIGALIFLTLTTATIVSVRSSIEARRERAAADARFEQVRELAKYQLFTLYDDLAQVPGSLPARVRLTENAQNYLDELAGDAHAPDGVRLETATGYLRLAQIQGEPRRPNIGKVEDAKRNLAKARSLLEPLRAGHPDDPAVALQLARMRVALANMAVWTENDTKAGEELLGLAAPLFQQPHPSTLDWIEAEASYRNAEVDMLAWATRFAEEEKSAASTIAWLDRLPAAIADRPALVRSRAIAMTALGEALYYTDRRPQALKYYRQADALVANALAKSPNDMVLMNTLLFTGYELIGTLGEMKYLDGLVERERKLLTLANRLALLEPADMAVAEKILIVENILAQTLVEQGAFSEAKRLQSNVLERLYAHHGRGTRDPKSLRDFAYHEKILSQILFAAGDRIRACALARQSFNRLTALDQNGQLNALDKNNPLFIPALKDMIAGC